VRHLGIFVSVAGYGHYDRVHNQQNRPQPRLTYEGLQLGYVRGIPEPGGPSPDELRQPEITELIEAAEIDLAELRLTRPAGNNAFDRFQRVLELAGTIRLPARA